MNKKGRHIPGIVLTVLFTTISLFFLYLLLDTKLVPQTILAVIAAVLILLILLYGFLIWNFNHIIRFSLGTMMIFLTSAVLLLGANYIRQTTSTLERISGVSTENSQMEVYVKNDDDAKTLSDTKDYKYGILKSLDRPLTDETVALLGDELKKDLETVEYPGLSQLIDGLTRGEVGAIVLNQAYWDILEELGYSRNDSAIRRLASKIIHTNIEPAPSTVNSDAPSAGKSNNIGQTSVYTIFISGIDSRNGMISKSRSDVNIITTINTETRQIVLVSTPRDYFVPLSISKGIPDKLTHAGIYGISVCMDTLGMLYDTEINYYFRINFDGFINIIDALGGISVESDYDFTSQNETGYHFVKGENEVDGKAALVFARERYAFKEGDRQRGKNQMAVIKGVIKKALSPELLKNYSSILRAVEGSFETNITYEEIASQLQKQLKDGGAWNIVTYSADGTGDTQKPYSMSVPAYVMIPDTATVDKAKELMTKVREGETITQEEAN